MDNIFAYRRWIGAGKDDRNKTGLPTCSVVVLLQSLLPVIKPGFNDRFVPAELFYPKPAGLVTIKNLLKLLYVHILFFAGKYSKDQKLK
jgi:hypothetical protein